MANIGRMSATIQKLTRSKRRRSFSIRLICAILAQIKNMGLVHTPRTILANGLIVKTGRVIIQSPPKSNSVPTKREMEEPSTKATSEYKKSTFMAAEISNNFLLFTTLASASSKMNPCIKIREFLDSGSPHTYIQADIALQQLKLTAAQQSLLELQGLGESTIQSQTSYKTTLYLQTRDSLPLQIHASTLPLITRHKFPFEIDKIREKFLPLKSLQYAGI